MTLAEAIARYQETQARPINGHGRLECERQERVAA
jgi:hypothetical protein